MGKDSKIDLGAIGFTALALAAFAGNSLLCRAALRTASIDAASFTSLRLGSGALVLWCAARFSRRTRAMQGGWASSIALFIYAAAFSFAYRKLTTATGALLLFGAVQLTMLTHGLVGGEHLVPRQWIGLILSFGGLLVLLLPGAASPPLFYGGLMLSSGIAWGVYSIRGKGSTAPPLEATTGNFVRTLPLAFALSLLTVTSSHVTANGALLALGSGAIASAGGYVIWYSVLPRLQRTTAAAVQLAVPVLASLFGVALLAEALTLRLVLLSCAILGGIGLVLLGPKRAS